MRFKRGNGSVVELSAEVVRILTSFRQLEQKDNEAGGILLGRLIKDSDNIIIDEIGVPGKKDFMSRLKFWRAKESAQEHVDIAWVSSDNTKCYLGEWHTHPEDYPSPSKQDLENWQTIVTQAHYEQESLFFVIVGIKSIELWELSKKTKILLKLSGI